MMITGPRKVGPARCRVRQSNSVPQHMRERIREVVDLEVPAAEQGKGYATTLMHKVCREADAANIILVLVPAPWGDHINLSAQQLEDWYAREFGFHAIQEHPVRLMARMVHGTPTKLQLNSITEALVKERRK